MLIVIITFEINSIFSHMFNLINTKLFLEDFFVNFCGFSFSDFEPDENASDYSGCDFVLNHNIFIKFRSSKVTTKKIGQFVTLWKKDLNGKNIPYDELSKFNYLIIFVKKIDKKGFFIFSKDALIHQKIISNKNICGKMGFRIYPPWDLPTNSQASKTQLLQKDFFYEITDNNNLKSKIKFVFLTKGV